MTLTPANHYVERRKCARVFFGATGVVLLSLAGNAIWPGYAGFWLIGILPGAAIVAVALGAYWLHHRAYQDEQDEYDNRKAASTKLPAPPTPTTRTERNLMAAAVFFVTIAGLIGPASARARLLRKRRKRMKKAKSK